MLFTLRTGRWTARSIAAARLVAIAGIVLRMFRLYRCSALPPHILVGLFHDLPERTSLLAELAVVFSFVALAVFACEEDERVCWPSHVLFIAFALGSRGRCGPLGLALGDWARQRGVWTNG